jgi:UDP-glucose 4-epimerase
VVVTGGCGFLGSRLAERLVGRGDEVTLYDPAPLPPGLACDPSGIRHVAGDIRDAATLATAITSGVDEVYHLTGVVGVDRYLRSPLDVIDVTVAGTRNVLDLSHRAGAKVVVAGTSEVYGRNPRPPWREDADRVLGGTGVDRWSYSSSKAVAEHMTFAFHRLGLRATVLRYFNVYGPRQRPAFVLSRTIHRLLRGLPPLLYDDGSQTRCFTFVDDAVEATLLAGASAAADGLPVNIGGEEETPVAEAVRMATRLAGADVRPVTVATGAELGEGYEDIPRRVPDTTRARELLGWKSRTSLAAGLRATIAWARLNPWWLEPEPGAEPTRNEA